MGRDTELRAALRALMSAEHCGAVLIGSPGVGKTRLATEVLDELPDRTIIRCYATMATSTIPFGALASVIPADLHTNNPLRHASEHLTGNVSGRLVLAVDDAHLLDESSVALLHHLMRHDQAKVLLTARPVQASELWRDEALVRLPIRALSRQDTDDLLASALGGPVDTSTRYFMWSRCEGNPLYLRELVSAGLASGALAEREGGWNWHGPLEMTGRLSELVEANLSRLSDPHRRTMELLAYGEPLELDLLAGLTSPDMVDELETLGLLRIEQDGRRAHVRLGHPLYGSQLRATCPTLRARAHHRALAERLEATGARRREDLMRIASWRLDSGSPASIDLLGQAASQAVVAEDWNLAERLCQAAVDLGGTAEVALPLSYVLMYRRSCAKAETVLAEIMAGTTDPVRLCTLGQLRSYVLFSGLGRYEDAIAMLDQISRADLPTELTDTLLFMRYGLALEYLPLAKARAATELMMAADAGMGWLPVAMRFLLATSHVYAGRFAESLAVLKQDEIQDATCYDWIPDLRRGRERLRCASFLNRGDLDRAESLAKRMLTSVIRQSRWTLSQTSCRIALSYCARLRGQAGAAMRLVAEGIAEHHEHPHMWDVLLLAESAMTTALYGQPAEAARALTRAEEACRPAWRMASFAVKSARSWVLASAGRVAEAAEAALHTAAITRAHGTHGVEIIALHDAARFGADTSARLAELAAERTDPLTTAFAAHAKGRARRDTQALEAVAADFAGMGVNLYAAEALAEAARLHRLAGRARQADQAASRQALLVAKLDHAYTPALQTDALASLTPRQLEVARLAVSGLTSQQIADRLHTSRRTVENHLYATYTALGVAGRDELREVLRAAGT